MSNKCKLISPHNIGHTLGCRLGHATSGNASGPSNTKHYICWNKIDVLLANARGFDCNVMALM